MRTKKAAQMSFHYRMKSTNATSLGMKSIISYLTSLLVLVSMTAFSSCGGGGGGDDSAGATLKITPEIQLNRNSAFVEFADDLADFGSIHADASLAVVIPVTDTLGEEHNLALYLAHTRNQVWTARLYANERDLAIDANPEEPILLGETQLTFNPDGSIVMTEGPREIEPGITTEPQFSNGAPTQAFSVSFVKTSEIDGSTTLISIDEVRAQ